MSSPQDENKKDTIVPIAERPVVVFPGAPGLAVEIDLEELEAIAEFEASHKGK